MTKENDFFKNYKDKSLTRPRDMGWGNWKAWGNEVGEKIEGTVVDAFYRPEEGVYKEQRGLTIKQLDGTLINVGVKYLPFVLSSTDELRIGDPIVMELAEIKEPSKKGHFGAKIFSFFGENEEENKGNKTVKELTETDKKEGGSVEPEPETETETPSENQTKEENPF